MAFFAQLQPDPYRSQAGQIGEAIGQGIGLNGQRQQMQQQQGQLAKALFGDQAQQFAGLPIEQQLKAAKLFEQQKNQQELSQILSSAYGNSGQTNIPSQANQSNPEMPSNNQQMPPIQKGPQLSDQQIAAIALKNPVLGKLLQDQKQAAVANLTAQSKESNKQNESNRNFHTGYSKKAVEEADSMRTSLPKVQMSLDFARDAVESGKVGALSLANLGERLGIPELQTARGAQLVTAAKENLIGTLSQVSARAQNQWMEQRINSMMSQIGKSKEANLASQELLEAEFAMKKAYLSEFDRLQEDDMKNFGYERNDIKKRAHNAVKPLEQHIFDRAAFRVLELQEQEEGLTKLKDRVGKQTTKGTFLTPAMTKLYVEKFGPENALKVAESNGYRIPSMEEFMSFQARPREFREGLENE